MKTICEFCKTEYTLNSSPASPVQCVVCGHVWNVKIPRKKNSFLVFIAAICALLAAIVFTFVVITHYNANNIKKNPLVAKISEINTVTDESGVGKLVVRGFVKNKTREIYGVPDLLIISRDKNGIVLTQQKVMSPATLLEGGNSAPFSYTLPTTVGVHKITVELNKE